MKNYIIFILLLSPFILIGQIPPNDQHWQIVWEDNFDFFDDNIWLKRDYCDHNGEPQLYLEENVWTENGKLVIKVDDDPEDCPDPPPPIFEWVCGSCTPGTHNYTSGWVHTIGNFNVQFGYIEARIKLSYGGGLWPAFWAFSGHEGYQEIDIFEMFPGAEEYCYREEDERFFHTNSLMTSNIHLYGPIDCDPYSNGSVSLIQDYTQWHTYGIEWSPSKLIWYLDGYPIKFYQNSQITALTHIILNLAINPSDKVEISSNFPAYMEVDFVKVWELKEDCVEFINLSNYDFSIYNNKLKNFIIIGDEGSSNILNTGDDIILRASQFIDINEITIPIGASLYADANKRCANDLSIECSQTFNPCTYDFEGFDNSTKKTIDLGGNGCILNISPVNNTILLKATDEIILKSGVSVVPSPGKPVELKIVTCN